MLLAPYNIITPKFIIWTYCKIVLPMLNLTGEEWINVVVDSYITIIYMFTKCK